MRRIYSFLRFHLASNPLNACFYYDEWSKNAILMQFLQKRRFFKDLFCRMKNLHLWINRKNRLNTKYLHIYFLLPLRTSWNCSDFYSKIDRLCTIVISSSRLLIRKILCVPFELNLHTCFPLLSLFFNLGLATRLDKNFTNRATCHRMHRKDKNKLLFMGVDVFN